MPAREAKAIAPPRVILLLAVLAPLALAPHALAGVCLPLCEVPGTTLGFVPPATALTSGSTVTWDATDGLAHTATARDGCFHVSYGRFGDGAATFTLAEDGRVRVATNQGGESDCAGKPLPGGAVELPYFCVYHPNMNGTLVIVPE